MLDLQAETGTEKRNIHKILKEDLQLRKIALKCVQDSLIEVEKWTRYSIYCDHLACYRQEGDHMLERIVAVDEF